MTRIRMVVFLVCLAGAYSSCVPKKHLVAAQQHLNRLQLDSAAMSNRIASLQQTVASLQAEVKQLGADKTALQQQLAQVQQQLDATRKNASTLLSNSQQTIEEQQKRLQQLQALMDQQKQNLEALRKKMADALVNFNSNELSVFTKDGKVYVSLQENLLFPSGSAEVNPKGKQALSQLAAVLNNNVDINVEIEGHTDSIPIRGRYEDNWALSTARATSIVRILTQDYKVSPTRVTASGRGEFKPVAANSTPEGRARNRRTEIILEPRLDELMRLLER